MTIKVAVIGSGLSAVGAIKALVRQGIRPVVLDCGETLDSRRANFADALSRKNPGEWSDEERGILGQNFSLNNGSSIPKKLLFGSDYFYGKPRAEAPVENTGNIPPFSYALGGFSVGWGAAILPPQACDLDGWPLEINEINKYCEAAISDLPYSAKDDGLSLNFPVLNGHACSLHLNQAEKMVLGWLHNASILEKDKLVFGQARLLVNPDSNENSTGCKYCGQCMSGCVYKSIYKATDDILALSKKGEIDYKPGRLVLELSENGDRVMINYVGPDGRENISEFDRVFLAAGAVNSTRIVLNSLKIFNKKAVLKTRGGFVMPVFSFRKLPIDWPNCNTQPGIFLELKGGRLKHWVHVQISTANELLYQKLKINAASTGLLSRIRKFLAEHIMLFFVNYHSDHAGHYELWLTQKTDDMSNGCLHSRHLDSGFRLTQFFLASFRILKICFKIGCLPLIPLAKNNSGSYHVGGTLPMRERPVDSLDTDDLGRVSAWKRVHVIDTSTFPSLPGTTIGILAMANAMRIVDKIRW